MKQKSWYFPKLDCSVAFYPVRPLQLQEPEIAREKKNKCTRRTIFGTWKRTLTLKACSTGVHWSDSMRVKNRNFQLPRCGVGHVTKSVIKYTTEIIIKTVNKHGGRDIHPCRVQIYKLRGHGRTGERTRRESRPAFTAFAWVVRSTNIHVIFARLTSQKRRSVFTYKVLGKWNIAQHSM